MSALRLVPSLIALATLTAGMTYAESAHARGPKALVYTGNGGGYLSSGNTSRLRAALVSAGASGVDYSASWPGSALKTRYGLVFLSMPTANFSAAQITNLKDHIAAGGGVVLIGEGNNFTAQNNQINKVAASLGVPMRASGSSSGSGGCGTSSRTGSHPLVSGAPNLQQGYAAKISGGTALYNRGGVLAAVSGQVVMVTDTNVWTQPSCNSGTTNDAFYKNLWSKLGGCKKLTWYRDIDADTWGNSGSIRSECTKPTGYVARGGDCNDRNRSIHPGATEIVGDEVDQNCDNREICYLDYDNDNWRLTSTIASADTDCRDSREARSSEPTLDCNDRNASINPGATERVGDEVDQNCDNREICYLDNDNDNWRLTSTIASADTDCRDSREARSSDPTLDCNDSDPAIHPGATEKIGDEVDQNCDTKELCYADLDNDKWRTNGTVVSADSDCRDSTEARASVPGIDCDDRRKETFPGAPEYCNGHDDDCDKAIDEDDALDAKTWYRDADGDSYGTISVTKKACKVPGGYVADDSDCDDSRKEVHPGADEYCNGRDDDCDKVIDEDAVDAKTWYEDSDGDTYGNPASVTKSCKVPRGYVADDTDCDDKDKTIYPGATEIPYDGIDQDCDGDDLCDVDLDGYDDPLCDGTDCDDTLDTVNPGADEIWYDGLDQDCDGWSDFDADYDGFDSADYEGDDCDDTDEAVNPDAEEEWYDGVDQNCDGESDYDADGDGFDSADYGGEDCDDDDDTVYPGADELEDGKDNDCNGVDEDDDTDGDGIPDEVELDIGTDPYNDDTDGDGVRDGDEVGDDYDSPADTDGDGTIDALDTDDDGDGILTEIELGDGPGDEPVDSDNDGTPDYLDDDSDGDGFLDKDEGEADSDGDGIVDYLDLDSDGDSVLDADELHDDTDGDGANDRVDSDDDNDGYATEVEESWDNPDLDGDGIENYLDPDSDGDGTDDVDEGVGDKDCDGVVNVLDADDHDGPCASADDLNYQSGACGGASTTGVPLGGAGLLLGLLGLLGVRRRR